MQDGPAVSAPAPIDGLDFPREFFFLILAVQEGDRRDLSRF
jgi:hypothetical protein